LVRIEIAYVTSYCS